MDIYNNSIWLNITWIITIKLMNKTMEREKPNNTPIKLRNNRKYFIDKQTIILLISILFFIAALSFWIYVSFYIT